jgi:hypothetical protein
MAEIAAGLAGTPGVLRTMASSITIPTALNNAAVVAPAQALRAGNRI